MRIRECGWLRYALRNIVAGLAAIGALLIVVTFTPLTLWWAQALSNPWLDADGDILIALVADGPNGGIIGQGTYWRSVYAIRAWQNGHFKTIILSGGNGTGETMRRFLIFQGVPANAIRVEGQSTSTRENALFTRELLRNVAGRKVLLTSDYHMYRAQRAFKKAGVDVLPRPFPEALKHGNMWWRRWPVFVQLAQETTKILGYRWKGWI